MALVAVVAALIMLCDAFTGIIWDGAFPLELKLVGTPKKEIIGVAHELLLRKERAEDCLPPRISPLHYERAPWADGQPLTVSVNCSGRATMLREVSFSQRRYMALRFDFVDGSRAFMTLDIPDGRVCRQVSVPAP
jgi:hypothetical protein